MRTPIKEARYLAGDKNGKPVQEFSGDEPILDAINISKMWGMVWPKVVARAWNGKRAGSGPDYEFYKDLVSCDPEKVNRCLYFEGFDPTKRYLHEKNKAPVTVKNSKWFYESTCIIVRDDDNPKNGIKIEGNKIIPNNQDKAYSIDITSGPSTYDKPNDAFSSTGELVKKTNGWSNAQCLQTIVLLKLPPIPANESDEAEAITDYIAAGRVNPFTMPG